jgi:hypothetical protein
MPPPRRVRCQLKALPVPTCCEPRRRASCAWTTPAGSRLRRRRWPRSPRAAKPLLSSQLTKSVTGWQQQIKNREHNLAVGVELVPAPLERRAGPCDPARRGRARRPRRRPRRGGRAPVHPPLELRHVVPEPRVHVPSPQRAGLRDPRRRRRPGDAARVRVADAAERPRVVVVARLRPDDGRVLPRRLRKLAVRAAPNQLIKTFCKNSNQTRHGQRQEGIYGEVGEALVTGGGGVCSGSAPISSRSRPWRGGCRVHLFQPAAPNEQTLNAHKRLGQ